MLQVFGVNFINKGFLQMYNSFFKFIIVSIITFSCQHSDKASRTLPALFISEPLPNRQNGFEENLIHDNNCKGFFYKHFPPELLKPASINDDYLSDLNTITHLKWKFYNTQDSVINFGKIFPDMINSVIYVAEIIKSDSVVNRILSFGSDDGISIWCNGDSLITIHRGRYVQRHDDFVQVNFKKGDNVLLYKIDQGTGGWALYKSFLNEEALTSFLRQNTALLYSDIFDTYILPDSAKHLILRKDTRRKFDYIHNIIIKWKTIDDIQFLQTQYLPVSLPGKIKLPVSFNGSALIEINIVNKKNITVYCEEFPVFFQSRALNLVQRLIKYKYSAPVGISRNEGLKKIWFPSNNKKYSTRMKAHVLLDCYRYQATPVNYFKYSGPQILGYKSKTDDKVQPYRIFIPSNYSINNFFPLTFITHGLFDKDLDFWESVEGSSHRYLVWRTYFSTESNHILCMPHGRGIENYLGNSIDEIPSIVGQLQNNWNIDTSRITILTYSKGARNILLLMSKQKIPIDTIVLVGPIIYEDETLLYGLLLRIKESYPNLKWYIRHGLDDSVSPIHLTRKLVAHLENLNFIIDYVEVPHSNHFNHLIDPERAYYQAQKNTYIH